MKFFAKCFSIAFLLQAIFLSITWSIEPIKFFGEMFVYLGYAAPYMLIASRENPIELSFFTLIVIPMATWSLIISLTIYLAVRFAKKTS